ncbi:hypothetical protein B0O99DRAFT_737440 [Bisporella sp. PMI_857]|nr:hypothetical protein B0O99DRAFT_737440 [Bisporella sp. PMI_857]
MRFSDAILAIGISAAGVIADCTFPYCYALSSKSYFYACESTDDCLSINRTECIKGLESPTPSGTVCFPWSGMGIANTTYVTPTCIYPYCFNVNGYYTYGCDTDADCQAVEKIHCAIGDLYKIGFLSGRCY